MDDKTFTERLELEVVGSYWRRIDDDAIGTILEIRDDNSNNLIVRWKHPSFEGSRAGEYDRYEFARKWVPIDPIRTIKAEDKEMNEITVGSIWRNVNGVEEYKGRLIKVFHINGDSISWRYLANAEGCPKIGPNMRSTKTTSESFLYSFEKVQDNDNGAIYQPFNRAHDVRENPGKYQMVKVVETNVSTTADGYVQTYGMIKFITVPIASCVYSLTLEEFHSEFELVSLNPAEEVSTDTNDSTDSEKHMDPNKGESKMENNNTYLKTDTSKLEDFGTGAKREDKTGKGRYDLIPGDIMSDFEDFAWTEYFKNGTTTCSPTDVSKSAYFDDWTNVELYYDFMFNVVSLFFVPEEDREECEDDNGEISYEITWEGFRAGLYNMRYVLAKHYEAGAAVHGVDNWKKGLPVYGSERGGCFLDSMRRHTDQALQGKVDEPHATAAIWNAIGAIWTLKHKKHSAMYQNASAVKAERKDQVDSLLSSIYGFTARNDIRETVDGDINIVEEPKTMKPSSDEKFNITKWPEGVDIVLSEDAYRFDVGNGISCKEIQTDRNLPDVDLLLEGGFNNIVDSALKPGINNDKK